MFYLLLRRGSLKKKLLYFFQHFGSALWWWRRSLVWHWAEHVTHWGKTHRAVMTYTLVDDFLKIMMADLDRTSWNTQIPSSEITLYRIWSFTKNRCISRWIEWIHLTSPPRQNRIQLIFRKSESQSKPVYLEEGNQTRINSDFHESFTSVPIIQAAVWRDAPAAAYNSRVHWLTDAHAHTSKGVRCTLLCTRNVPVTVLWWSSSSHVTVVWQPSESWMTVV